MPRKKRKQAHEKQKKKNTVNASNCLIEGRLGCKENVKNFALSLKIKRKVR